MPDAGQAEAVRSPREMGCKRTISNDSAQRGGTSNARRPDHHARRM